MKDQEREKIEEFWEWFVNNETHIKEVLADDYHEGRKSLVKTMDNQILQFGMFTWEMGPEGDKNYYLIISPNGNGELLEKSKEIIALSPGLRNWKFYYARPAKEWDLKFSVFDDFMEEHKVDASGWNFILEKSEGNSNNIIVEAQNLKHLDEETKLTAGNLVVSSLLGEAFKINFIDKVKIVNHFESLQESNRRSIFELYNLREDLS